MIKALVWGFVILASFASSVSARVWYVKPDSTGQAINIQAGIDSCAAGDTVVAMPGIFTGDGNWDIDFKGKPIVVMAARIFDPTITDETIIDGQGEGGDQLHGGFYFHSNEDSASVLSGFVIQNFFMAGAAIVCDHSSPTILGNETRNFRATDGIDCIDSSPKIIGNLIIIESGGAPQALSCDGGSPYIANNTLFVYDCSFMACGPDCGFNGCTSLHLQYNSLGYAQIDNCTGTVDNNDIGGYYGGLEISSSVLSITNNRIGTGSWGNATVSCMGSAVLIANNQLISGAARYCGRGIQMVQSLPSWVINNDIQGGECTGGEAGAIEYDGDSTTVIESNIIHGFEGSGIRCYSSIRIANNVIHSNYNGYQGGGIYCSASPVIEGNTIVGNSAYYGVGIYCAAGASPTIRNNIIASNVRRYEEAEGGGIYADSLTFTVACNDIYGNEGGNYVGIPDQTGLNGNISQDPLFCDSQHRDFSLHVSSPCLPGNHPDGADCGLIGARGMGSRPEPPRGLAGTPLFYNGNLIALLITWNHNVESNIFHYRVYKDSNEDFIPGPSSLVASPVDTFFYDGQWRWMPPVYYKIAAVDSNGNESRFALLGPDDVTGVESTGAPQATYLSQCYPNPFNPATSIFFGLDRPVQVSLRIYDAAGRLVRLLVDGARLAGIYTEIWDGRDTRGAAVASGVYFYRLTAGPFTQTRKMVLIR